MSKKVKLIAHLKVSCNYDGDIEFENHEELVEKVTELVTNSIWEMDVEEVEVDEEEKENV